MFWQGAAQQGTGELGTLLASFTVPVALVGPGEAHAGASWLAAWLADMQAAVDASDVWARAARLRLEVSTVSCCVAL